MPFVNLELKKLTYRVVIYGIGLSGKTTTVARLNSLLANDELISVASENDRALLFTYNTGLKFKRLDVYIQVITMPGSHLNRDYIWTKMLENCDGVVIIIDSQKSRLKENILAITALRSYIKNAGGNIDNIPVILQYNKRDLPNSLTLKELNRNFGFFGWKYIETIATEKLGLLVVFETILKMIIK
ncbi:GTPase domain-containing protein [Chloroflexia bacterium SDU3-3]|nr:GTPase domain-containing protein [Chloroflexia bacterium SDU3-3]